MQQPLAKPGGVPYFPYRCPQCPALMPLNPSVILSRESGNFSSPNQARILVVFLTRGIFLAADCFRWVGGSPPFILRAEGEPPPTAGRLRRSFRRAGEQLLRSWELRRIPTTAEGFNQLYARRHLLLMQADQGLAVDQISRLGRDDIEITVDSQFVAVLRQVQVPFQALTASSCWVT